MSDTRGIKRRISEEQDRTEDVRSSQRLFAPLGHDTLPHGLLYEFASALYSLAPLERPQTLAALEEIATVALGERYTIDESVVFSHLLFNEFLNITESGTIAFSPNVLAPSTPTWRIFTATAYPSDRHGVRVAPEFLGLLKMVRDDLRDILLASKVSMVERGEFFEWLGEKCVFPRFSCRARDLVDYVTATSVVIAGADGMIQSYNLDHILMDRMHFRCQLVRPAKQ